MYVVGWFYPKEIPIKRNNTKVPLFKAILCNNEEPPFTIALACWGKKAYEVSTKVRNGMVRIYYKSKIE